jgi:hypothetical protein
MVKTLAELKVSVHERVKKTTVDKMVKYIEKSKISLWGLEKGRQFLRNQIYVQLYKDMFAIGYWKIHKDIKNWNKIGYKSIRTNTRRIRHHLFQCSKKYITPGTTSDWKYACRNVELGNDVADASLWMDSTDCRLQGKYTVSKNDPSWSFKLKSPGQRYMTIIRVRHKSSSNQIQVYLANKVF